MEHEIKNALDAVRCEEELKRSTLAFLNAHRNMPRRPSLSLRRLSPVLALMVLVISVFTFRYYQAPVAYVSIDINPSIELSLNRLGNVTGAQGYNEEGARILDDVSLKGLSMTGAIEKLLSSNAMQPYLTPENDLCFTVAAQDPQQEEALLSAIAQNSLCQQNQGRGYRGDMEAIQAAHQCGMSFGKYNAYLELSQYDSSITAEQCRAMSMSQIRACIHKYGNTSSESASPDPSLPETPQSGMHHRKQHHRQK